MAEGTKKDDIRDTSTNQSTTQSSNSDDQGGTSSGGQGQQGMKDTRNESGKTGSSY